MSGLLISSSETDGELHTSYLPRTSNLTPSRDIPSEVSIGQVSFVGGPNHMCALVRSSVDSGNLELEVKCVERCFSLRNWVTLQGKSLHDSSIASQESARKVGKMWVYVCIFPKELIYILQTIRNHRYQYTGTRLDCARDHHLCLLHDVIWSEDHISSLSCMGPRRLRECYIDRRDKALPA